jgi:hypothetical protein
MLFSELIFIKFTRLTKTLTMKKNSTIEGKVARYTAVAAAALAANSAEAQLQYIDFNPDLVYNNSTGAIDLTGDGMADFAFADTVLSATATVVAAIPVGSNGIAGSQAGSYYYPFQLNANDAINSGLSWISSSNQGSLVFIANGSPYGQSSHWQTGVTDKYLGFRLSDGGGGFYYGWFRCDLSADLLTFTIKDMGWNTTLNAAINAGQYNVSVSETLEGKVNVVNVNNILNISTTEVFTNGNVTVTSMNGQVVANQAINGTASVDLNSLASGIYVVNVTFNEGVYTQKVFVK